MVRTITAVMRTAVRPPPYPRQPVFLFPGLNGDEPLLALFRAELAADVNFVTMSYPDWRTHLRAEYTFESLVEELASQIADQAVPIRLAGYSFGGLVAAAVAARLRTQGLQVCFLMLIDTPALPGRELPVRTGAAGRTCRQRRHAAGIGRAPPSGHHRFAACGDPLPPGAAACLETSGRNDNAAAATATSSIFERRLGCKPSCRSQMLRRGSAAGVSSLARDIPNRAVPSL